MKRLFILIFVASFLVGCSAMQKQRCEVSEQNWYDQYHVVAHAMGGINGYDYTNSLEAFLSHYEQGTRVFEVDLQMTTDGKFALVHEWDQYHSELIESDGGWSVDSQFFKEHLIHGEYTPLLLDDLIELMQEYCDVYWIIDSKTFDESSASSFYNNFIDQVSAIDASLLRRFIPQAYSPEIYTVIEQTGKFKDIIFTLYAYYVDHDGHQVCEFVKEKGIHTVVMHMNDDWAVRVIQDVRDYAFYDQYIDQLRIYIHTINDYEMCDRIYLDENFTGVYSDEITEDSWNMRFE